MKNCKHFISLFYCILFVFFLFPITVYASNSGEVNLSKFNITTLLQKDGSIIVSEDITFNFNGSFNGAYRDISTEKTGGISKIVVSEISNGSETQYTKVQSAKNGDKNVYQLLNEKENIVRIKIFCPSKDQEKSFRISYTMSKVAVKYEDTGEFYYKYWSNTNETKINNMNISFILPDKVNANEISAFGHGTENGSFNISSSKVDFHVSSVPPKTMVEVRVLFPKTVLSASNNILGSNSLSRIISEEKAFSENVKKEAIQRERIKSFFNLGGLILSGFAILILFININKFKRKEEFDLTSYSGFEIPEDCTPAVAAYLCFGITNGKIIYATILDLWKKGYLNLEKLQNSNETDFKIVKVRDSGISLLKHEAYFFKWIINEIGNGEYVTTEEIKSKLSKNAGYSSYNEWNKLIKEDAKARKYYDDYSPKIGGIEILLFILFFILSIIGLVNGAYYCIFSNVFSLILFIHGISLCFRKSNYGYKQYLKWKKFRKMISQVNGEALSDSCIPYAEALNISTSSMCNLKMNFKNVSADPSYYNNSWLYYYLIFDSLELKDKNTLHHSIYSSFGTGSSGTTGSFSGGGTGGGGAGGGGAGGF